MFDIVSEIIHKIKNQNPLILNITNAVTIEFIANGLLSVGASPIMSQAEEEMEDLIKLANVVVINVGTLNNDFIKLCEYACELANKLNKPIIFDPVGAGASLYRTETCKRLLNNYHITILRANAGEVMALAGNMTKTKGVDSIADCDEAVLHAKQLSSQYNMTVCMSGKTDVIVNHDNIKQLNRGSHLMPLITGTGCLLTAMIGTFYAVHQNSFAAATAASLFYSICGEIAAEQSNGPGSFKTLFLDTLNAPLIRSHYE
jgi:hydroxyethylthiazole kinase